MIATLACRKDSMQKQSHEHFNATSLYNQGNIMQFKNEKPSLTVYLESLNKTKNSVQDYISRTIQYERVQVRKKHHKWLLSYASD